MTKPKYKPTKPSAAIAAKYERQMIELIDEMRNSFLYWIGAEYKRQMAMDGATKSLKSAMRKIERRWLKRFNEQSRKMASYFALSIADRCDDQLRKVLKTGGMSVKFEPTQLQQNALMSIIEENTALIKSIPQEFMAKTIPTIHRAFTQGRDVKSVYDAINQLGKTSKKKASLIARHQNSMATSMLEKIRHEELGVTQAIWRHSSAGKTPRAEHVAFSGKTYSINRGAYLEGKYTWPGIEINCRCYSEPIIKGFND